MAAFPTFTAINSATASPSYGNTITIWTNWTTSATTGSLTSSNVYVWNAWNTGASTTMTLTGTNVWPTWMADYEVFDGQRAASAVRQAQQRTQPTDEQLAAWRERERLQREQTERVAVELRTARARARVLLLQCLTAQQREDLEAKKCFYLECHSKDGSKRTYRIDEGTHGNVKLLDEAKRVVGSYCVQPSGVPTEDAMLAQVLWLKTDEEEFKRKANFRRFAA